MATSVTIGSPKCPNHHCPLLKTGDRYKWQCPISMWIFAVEIDTADKKEKLDKFGNKMTTYKITGKEPS